MTPLQVAKGIFLLIALPLFGACTPIVATGSAATNLVALQDRSVGTTIDDATIYGRITERLVNLDSKEAYRGVSIEVSEGRVLMMGQLSHPDNVEKVLRVAWKTPGVREVINEIQIVDGGKGAGPVTFANDAFVTTQAKGRLVAERGIASANYAVETVNGVVYVMGIARSEQELQQALNVISRAAGARKVVSHVRVRPVIGENDELPDMADPSVAPIS